MAINTKNLVKTVATLTKSLSPRNKDIISRRFGLKSGKKETLESIGKGYGITRERVRQIEEFSINQLSKNIAGESSVNGVVLAAKDFIATHKGVVKEADLFKALTGNDKENIANASLHFILTLSGEPVRFGENDAYHTFWALDKNHAENYKESIATLVKTLSKHGELVHHDKFLDFAVSSGVATPTGDSLSHDNFQAMLAVSKEIGKNVFNQVGLTKWSEVKPKGVRDKAYLVLKREKEPLHFSDIAKAINAIGFSNKKANIQTVHNELIKDTRFVLVGRGMYGLSEWGYKPGTVKDVLVDVLRTSSKSLSKDDLIKKVMSARMVKENTIILNLQDSRTFIRKEDGTYSLKK